MPGGGYDPRRPDWRAVRCQRLRHPVCRRGLQPGCFEARWSTPLASRWPLHSGRRALAGLPRASASYFFGCYATITVDIVPQKERARLIDELLPAYSLIPVLIEVLCIRSGEHRIAFTNVLKLLRIQKAVRIPVGDHEQSRQVLLPLITRKHTVLIRIPSHCVRNERIGSGGGAWAVYARRLSLLRLSWRRASGNEPRRDAQSREESTPMPNPPRRSSRFSDFSLPWHDECQS